MLMNHAPPELLITALVRENTLSKCVPSLLPAWLSIVCRPAMNPAITEEEWNPPPENVTIRGASSNSVIETDWF
jgi:hypothetical protein